MRKKKIIIHIGLPKCGSTSLQAYLARKADDMRVAGYDYPTSGAFYFLGSKNHLWLALSFGLQTPFFLTLSKQRRQLAKQHIKNAQESFNLGAMSIFDFDLVRNRFVNAQSTLIRNKFDFIFKTKVLQFYYGELNLD